ncbi:MAG: tetratricopeptide (TPR) repeat protein [Candidatus Azotimanducaceae bacterium]|jgi:tetratricopeptide (TPR) repeat protein
MNKLTVLLFAASITASSLTAQSSINNQLWSDPTFVKEFLGSYGFLAGAEPQISDEEKEALRNLIDLIKVNPKAAIGALEPQITQSSSAAFDFILANLYFQEGNLAKAEQFYTTAVVKHPDFRRAYKNLGLVQVQKGDFDKAITTISKAMELGEVDGRSYGLLGYGYLTQERYYPAEAAYRQAILMQPDVTDWKVGLARCLLETQRYADAIALFDTLLLDEPTNPDYWLLQGNAYLGKGDSLAAAKNLDVVRRMGAADLSTLTLLGDIYMNNDAPDLALEAYLAANKVATAADSKSLLRAAELLSRTGNYTQSKTMIGEIRAKMGAELHESTDRKLLTIEAKIARAEGDDEAAVELLSKIVERDALNGEAIIELANFYADQGDMAKAINRFEQAEKIEAFEREALVAHAQARVRNGEYKVALPLLRRALQLKSDNNLEDYAQRVERAAKSQG